MKHFGNLVMLAVGIIGQTGIAGAGVQRAASPLCRGAGAAAHCWGQGATPIGGLRAAAPSGQG